MARVDLATGSTFARRYRILERLASGGMGAVYAALHLETRRRRALKVMLPELFTKPELRDRFRREAHVTASVKSEFLVDVFDAGVDDASGMPFLVMELLEGEDLGRLVDRSGALPPSEVVELLHQTASALDRTHAASIVHRDLKPENLFLTRREDGSPCIKILDFGISKIMNEATTGGKNTTSIGTPAYMAPEQIVGGPVSTAADLHSLGLIAYTLLTGRAYWQDDVESTDNALAFALRAAQGIREGAVSRAGRHGHTLPHAFDAWFARAVELEPTKRFGSASETVAALAEALDVPLPVAPSGRSVAQASGARSGASDIERASTMHGAELGPKSSKPGTVVRWLAAGGALGILGVGIAAIASRGGPEPAPSGAAATSTPTPPTEPANQPIVLPLEGAVAPAEPAPSAAPSALAVAASGRAQDRPRVALAGTKPSTVEKAAAPPPAAAPVASTPAAATASFPAASARPKPKYTRD
jgi:serine/threonine-protein kinase